MKSSTTWSGKSSSRIDMNTRDSAAQVFAAIATETPVSGLWSATACRPIASPSWPNQPSPTW